MSRVAAIALVGLLLLLGLPALGATASAAPPQRSLRVLFTHDLHSHLAPVRIATEDGGEQEYGGFARIASVIQSQRAQAADATLVLDAGDFSMGTLFHTAYTTDALELRALGRLGYDAVTLGNHEFDFHSSGLAQMLASAKASGERLPAVVAANVVLPPGDTEVGRAFGSYPVREYTVVEKNGLRIGVFGLLGKDAADDVGFAKDVSFADQIAAARRVVDVLKNQEKVDVVIALSHQGTSTDTSRSEDEILAREVPRIDLIVSGHTHTVLPKPIVVGRTTIVSAGSYGRYVGVVDLDFAKGDGGVVTSYELREIGPAVAADPEVAAAVDADKRLVEQRFLAKSDLRFDQPIAETAFNLESLEQFHLAPGETGLGDVITDAFREAVRQAEGDHYVYVNAALHPVGAIRDSFVRGPITADDTFRVLSLGLGADDSVGYPLAAFYVTGDELKQALEVESTLAALKGDYHLQVSGLRFAYNPNRVPLDRVTGVLVSEPSGDYRSVEPGRLYRICVDYQVAAMLGSVSAKSYGLLRMTPKDQAGNPIADVRAALVDADPKAAGTQELKAWSALASYLKAMSDVDGDRVPDLPDRYRKTESRIAAVPSWSPTDLLGGAGYITFGAAGVAVVALGLLFLVLAGVARLVRRVRRGVTR